MVAVIHILALWTMIEGRALLQRDFIGEEIVIRVGVAVLALLSLSDLGEKCVCRWGVEHGEKGMKITVGFAFFPSLCTAPAGKAYARLVARVTLGHPLVVGDIQPPKKLL